MKLKAGTPEDERRYVKQCISDLTKGIKQDLTELGIGDLELAQSLGVTPKRLKAMLNGTWPMTASLLARIAYRLEIWKVEKTNKEQR